MNHPPINKALTIRASGAAAHAARQIGAVTKPLSTSSSALESESPTGGKQGNVAIKKSNSLTLIFQGMASQGHHGHPRFLKGLRTEHT